MHTHDGAACGRGLTVGVGGMQLYEADGSIGRASNTLQGMVRRAYQQKAITYAIIVLLVFLM